jgi:hypothetical protein
LIHVDQIARASSLKAVRTRRFTTGMGGEALTASHEQVSAYHARQLPAICGKALPPQLFDLLHLVPTTADSTVAVRGSS